MDRTGAFGHWLRQRRKALGLRTRRWRSKPACCARITLRKIETGDLDADEEQLLQVVALDEAIGHPDLESDRAELARIQSPRGSVALE